MPVLLYMSLEKNKMCLCQTLVFKPSLSLSISALLWLMVELPLKQQGFVEC